MSEPRPPKRQAAPAALDVSAQETLTLAAIQEAIQSIRFGVVQIVIQDGRIVQIDKTEKIRLV